MPNNLEAENRVKAVSEYMAAKHPNARPFDIGNFTSGPRENRKLTSVSYVEFGSSDSLRAFLATLPTSTGKISLGNFEVFIKAGRTKLNGQRNHFLKKALELIKKAPGANGKECNIDWKERCVTVGGNRAFEQSRDEIRGTFLASFAGLNFD
jgi:hypothetical protein